MPRLISDPTGSALTYAPTTAMRAPRRRGRTPMIGSRTPFGPPVRKAPMMGFGSLGSSGMGSLGDNSLGAPAGGQIDIGPIPEPPTDTSSTTTTSSSSSSSSSTWDKIGSGLSSFVKGITGGTNPYPGVPYMPSSGISGGTLLLLGGAGVLAFMMMRKKK